MKKVILYTDGACSGNPGPGGYAAVLLYNGNQKIISGGEKNTTNNKMEMMAVIKGLEALKEPCIVEVYSDSAYVVNAIEKGWIQNWKKKGWKKADKSEVKNIDLWERLLKELEIHEVTFNKVKGHADDSLNNLCDKIAVSEREKLA